MTVLIAGSVVVEVVVVEVVVVEVDVVEVDVVEVDLVEVDLVEVVRLLTTVCATAVDVAERAPGPLRTGVDGVGLDLSEDVGVERPVGEPGTTRDVVVGPPPSPVGKEGPAGLAPALL